MIKVILKNSTRKIKKYMVILYDGDKKIKTIHFGAKGQSDYTIHKDNERKNRYIKRHAKNENWQDYKTAGFWSKNLLWNLKTIKKSQKYIEKKYKLKIINKIK